MRKVIKKSSSRKRASAVDSKNAAVELTASDRRILQIIATGTETEEPDGVLAGVSFRFIS